jgi:hypothetical protein
MHIIGRDEIVTQHMADLHRQAAKQRLLRELRASRKPTVRRRRIWERLTVRRPRPEVLAGWAQLAGALSEDLEPSLRAAPTVGRAPQPSDHPTALLAEQEAS